ADPGGLAARAGLRARAISDLERGINQAPRKETLRLLAEAFQLSAEACSRLEAALRWPTTDAGSLTTPERGPFSDLRRVPLARRAEELARLEQHLAGVRKKGHHCCRWPESLALASRASSKWARFRSPVSV